MPAMKSTELLDGSYASDLTEMIMHYQPDLWVHGHLHKSCNYQIGKARIICNPRGYVTAKAGRRDELEEENPMFDPSLVVTL